MAKPVGEMFRVVRLYRGLSQPTVARGAKIPVARLSRLERGLATPTPAEFLRVWNFLSSDPPPQNAGRTELS